MTRVIRPALVATCLRLPVGAAAAAAVSPGQGNPRRVAGGEVVAWRPRLELATAAPSSSAWRRTKWSSGQKAPVYRRPNCDRSRPFFFLESRRSSKPRRSETFERNCVRARVAVATCCRRLGVQIEVQVNLTCNSRSGRGGGGGDNANGADSSTRRREREVVAASD